MRRREAVKGFIVGRRSESGHVSPVIDKATTHWTLSWLALAFAFGVHVADEAANDFLGVWNPLVESLRERIPLLPLPTFSFKLWLGGLIVAVLVILLLSLVVRRGAVWMRPVSYVLAVIMLGNGLLHILGSLNEGRALPGVYSSPLLLVTAGLLLATALRHRAAGTGESDARLAGE